MSAKAELKKRIQLKAPPVHQAAAATVAAQTVVEDAPSEANVDLDFDFLNLDPTEVQPYYDRLGLEGPNPAMALRWCETDPRMFNRRLTQGWKPAAEGRIKNGSTMLCEMPKARHTKMKEILASRAEDQKNSYMRNYDDKVRREGGRHFQPFDGPRGPRDGLD